MTAAPFLRDILAPGLANLASLGGPPPSERATVLLLAIAGQESAWAHRYQVLSGGRKGPARGFWQFEMLGGCAGVLEHPASRAIALRLCQQRDATPTPKGVWQALETDDILAAGFARLLLWTDPDPLPRTGWAAWECYRRAWRPGKPHPDAWPANYTAALQAVAAQKKTPEVRP